eukprot:Nitzschia sp. Nitz4//scaffold57_size113557//83627//86971//NITZ4_004003-RA/size113557-augustus-gene-0.61-mRNA-1//1//CDS//3329554882//8815//frame0
MEELANPFPSPSGDSPSKPQTELNTNEEEYGDISLGMKLIVVGGRVIVQMLNSLSDGRASPAQAVGTIRRGDILLAVGDLSLVNLPIDQLMHALKPLSSPETPDGRYKRVLEVRLEAGTGHGLLSSHERGHKLHPVPPTGGGEGPPDTFNFFPMVDQLSGAPLFEPPVPKEKPTTTENLRGGAVSPTFAPSVDAVFESLNDSTEVDISPDEQMSNILANQFMLDRQRFASEYFNWKEELSALLKQRFEEMDTSVGQVCLTKSERVDLGLKVMDLAKKLTFNIEDIDKGKDLRSFKTWSTSFSTRSGANARRRQVMDATSIRSLRPAESGDDDNSVASENSESLGSIDGDALLLGLAAHDDIWKQQVLEALRNSIEIMKNDTNTDTETKDSSPQDGNKLLPLPFGAFLFGDHSAKTEAKKKYPYSLPPPDITTVLFDLVTHIATTAPEEITVFGGTIDSHTPSFQSSLETQGKAKSQCRADTMVANRFVLDEALPVWLQSFRPLGVENRRILWPRVQRTSLSSFNANVSDNDSATVGSTGSKSSTRAKKKRDSLQVDEDENESETRAETDANTTNVDEEVKTFIERFGCYLQIHSSLSVASSVEAREAVLSLLKVARHDPVHKDAIKEIRNAEEAPFYDIGKLSAILELLGNIRFQVNSRLRDVVKDMCVSGYPDVQSWLVKQACVIDSSVSLNGSFDDMFADDSLRSFYYSYLSLLMDPTTGNEDARKNSALVKEWCTLSLYMKKVAVGRASTYSYLDNFHRVASKASSAHLGYHRDLPTLLDMSMSIDDYDLSLELIMEIIENKRVASKLVVLRRVVECLREIGVQGLERAWKSKDDPDTFHMIKRVVRAFQQMSNSTFATCRESVDVAAELLTLLQHWSELSNPENRAQDVLLLVDFMVNESPPFDVLSTLVEWSTSHGLGPELFSHLQSLLRRGAQVSLKTELSGSMLRLKEMRCGYTDYNKPMAKFQTAGEESDLGSLWQRMSIGTLTIDK